MYKPVPRNVFPGDIFLRKSSLLIDTVFNPFLYAGDVERVIATLAGPDLKTTNEAKNKFQ